MLFKYGVRINNDFVMDMQAAPIPVVTGYVGNQPKQEIFPWYYYPLLSADSKNPIVNNLNMVKTEFASSIDTIETESVTKTILLTSSKLSRLQMAPARVSLNILRDKADPMMFNRRNIPIAVLLEENFNSNFEIAANGITRYGLSIDAIKSVLIPIPPIEEQKSIVDFILDKTSEIDIITKRISQEIELIKEYRTSLINEVVTGKITLN